MSVDFRAINPQWAWDAYSNEDGRWGPRLVSHLWRRAGFAASPLEMQLVGKMDPRQAVEAMMTATPDQGSGANQQFETESEQLVRAVIAGGNPESLSAAWAYRLLNTPWQLLEKTTLFWHGHFATSAEKVEDPKMMWQQNQFLRQYSLGDFRVMTQGVAQDPAMLIYLDSVTNRKSHPNENFARELMELFCLGEGHYTEQDVQELSRCFTGWEIKNGKFRKNRYQQDRGVKTVLDQSGEFDGDDGVEIVLRQPQMALFICRKLARYFVCDEPTLTDELLQPLANEFRNTGLSIGSVVQKILASNLFFSEQAVARKIRSPVELVVGLMRALEGSANTVELAKGMRSIGQGLFYPPNVKGWDGGRTWINTSTLIGRANLVNRLLSDENTRFGGGTLEAFMDGQGLDSSAKIIDWLETSMLAVPLLDSKKKQLKSEFERTGKSRDQRLRGVVHALAAMPEFQIG